MPLSKRAVFILLATVWFSGIACAADQRWSRLEGCKWLENPSNDGDSFHVEYRGKEFIFRLYFVDTCEDSEQVPARVEEQAKTFRITAAQVLAAGRAAQNFTHGILAGHPFTVVTRWEDARGASRLPRNYAFVLFGNNDEHDLASTLAQNGLVRIYGMPADPPGPVTDAQFRAALLKLDAEARKQRLGIFGNLSASGGAAGSGIAAGSAAGGGSAHASEGSSMPILLPASSHPPDVVDNPVDSELDAFAIQAAESPAIIHAVIPSGDYSEIPGWKPSATPADTTPADSEPPPDEKPLGKPTSEKIDPSGLITSVSINRATERELMALPGVGPVFANRIIASRPYKSVDDLLRVTGIGKKQVERLRPFLAL